MADSGNGGPSGRRFGISPKIERRLAAYAATAGAGLGLLASAPTAEAKIVYTPAQQKISSNTSFALDVNHDGVIDFTLTDTYGCNFDYCYGRLSAIPIIGNGVEGALGFLGTQIASALNLGAQVGPARLFSGQLMASTNMGTNGQWLNVTNRYLGLRFQINGQTHFGWARLTVQVKSAHVGAVLTGYAYETLANTPIAAGRTSGNSPVSVMGKGSGPSAFLTPPAPHTASPLFLGILALGAQGLSLWRRSGLGDAQLDLERPIQVN